MKKCQQYAAYNYTWPGKDQSCICEEHSHKLQAIASAIGLHLQLIPIDKTKDITSLCEQRV